MRVVRVTLRTALHVFGISLGLMLLACPLEALEVMLDVSTLVQVPVSGKVCYAFDETLQWECFDRVEPLSLNGVTEGDHTLHVQIRDTQGTAMSEHRYPFEAKASRSSPSAPRLHLTKPQDGAMIEVGAAEEQNTLLVSSGGLGVEFTVEGFLVPEQVVSIVL